MTGSQARSGWVRQINALPVRGGPKMKTLFLAAVLMGLLALAPVPASAQYPTRPIKLEPVGSSPEQLSALILEDGAKWSRAIKMSGATLD